MNQENLFTKYGGCLLYQGVPHLDVVIDEEILKVQIKKTKSLFARYFVNSQLINSKTHIDTTNSWWHCVCDSPMSIDNLTSKQRYRVKKGLKLNDIYLATYKELNTIRDELVSLLIDSYSDYPKIYKPDEKAVQAHTLNLIESCLDCNNQIWLVRDKESSKLVGMSYCRFQEDMVHLSVVKVRPSFLKNEVNAALVFELCHYYMNVLCKKYVCDGERNIRHITNFQDFLCRVLNFHLAYCELHVVYHPLIKPFIQILYPFRKIIQKIDKNKLLYNIGCLLKQEEIARKYRKS